MFYAMEQALKRAFPLKRAFHKDRFAQWFSLCVAGCRGHVKKGTFIYARSTLYRAILPHVERQR